MPRWLSYVCFAVWLGPILVLFFWDGYLSLQMWNYRVQKQDGKTVRGRRFAFQTDPMEFTEAGQVYRRISIRLEIALLAWAIGPVLAAIIVAAIFHPQ